MTTPRVLSALDIARDKDKYDLDTKPERWILGPPFDRIDVRPRRVILLGAPPGAGKTTLSLQLVSDALERNPQLRCVVGNVETAPPLLLDKLLARFAAVPLDAVMNREFLDSERARIDESLRARADLLGRFGFLESPYSVPNLFNGMKAFNARLAVVDYVQRFSAGDKEDRAKLDAVMGQIRTLADQGAAIFVVSSVARQRSNNGSSTYGGLTMAAFRGSAELEFGADSAFILHSDPATGIAMLESVKERFGTPRDIPLRFCGEFQPSASSGQSRRKGKPSPMVRKVFGWNRFLDGLANLEPGLHPLAVAIWCWLWRCEKHGRVRARERKLAMRFRVGRGSIRARVR